MNDDRYKDLGLSDAQLEVLRLLDKAQGCARENEIPLFSGMVISLADQNKMNMLIQDPYEILRNFCPPAKTRDWEDMDPRGQA